MIALALALAVAPGSWTHISDGGWEPSAAQTNLARAALHRAVLAQIATENRERIPNWSTYAFQYQGRVISGRNVIVVNAFCDIPPYASKQWVMVLDGGACFFTAFFDVKTGKYAEVAFNGYG